MTAHPTTGVVDHNLPVFSVGEISAAVKRHIEGTYDHVRVRGEMTGFRRAQSGHLYFSLKDDTALLKGCCWRSAALRLTFRPEDGIEVLVTGRLSTYAGRSEYQIVAESIELAGEGALLKLLEDRRRRLAAEGLFAAERKRPIPYLPAVIGVVTSASGAVIRDILHRVSDRFPRHVLLWPVAVQGDGAAEQVAAAITGFANLPPGGPVPRPDVVIVARGGGSLEDLWPFNEEIVVRATASSSIPVISAVGHETDTTLIDHAADRRAPTPTAAAEMAVPVRADLAARVVTIEARLIGSMNRAIAERRVHVDGLARGLPRPAQLIDECRQRLDDWGDRLGQCLSLGLDRKHDQLRNVARHLATASPLKQIEAHRSRTATEAKSLGAGITLLLREQAQRVAHLCALLESYSYQRVLERGFTLVHGRLGKTVTSSRTVRPNMPLTIRFHDGEAAATADSGDARDRRPRRTAAAANEKQGTLL